MELVEIWMKIGLINFMILRCSSANARLDAVEQIMATVNKVSYNKNVLPPSDGPLEVGMSMHINDISFSNNFDLAFECFFRMHWKDSRLQFNSDIDRVVFRDYNKFWIPDVFFPGSTVAIRKSLENDAMFKVNSDGSVLLSTRIAVKRKCKVGHEHKNFPDDAHTCKFDIESYSFTNDVLKISPFSQRGSLVLEEKVSMENFLLKGYFIRDQTVITSTGNYTGLTVYFRFMRDARLYTATFYIPIVMLAIIAFYGLLSSENFVAQLLLTILPLLCTTAASEYQRSQLPPVNYARKIDIFSGISVTVMFCSLTLAVMKNFCKNIPQTDITQEMCSASRLGYWVKKIKANLFKYLGIILAVAYLIFIIIFMCYQKNEF